MSETQPSMEVALREARAELVSPLPPMRDSEIAAAYRTAKGFAEGGLFKDARDAGKAFTKILAGRDLGLTPFESMSALHVYEGKIEAGADLHASKVRQRKGYDFRVAWLKVVRPSKDASPPEVEAVWADEENLADVRDIYGIAIAFTVEGKLRGISRFTHADAVVAKLQNKDNHSKYPRNMFFARAMTNGVAWYVPEVMGGVRVYGLGEVVRHEDVSDVDGTADPIATVLPTAVEAIIARAKQIGHAGLSNRSAVAMAVGGQPEEFVAKWCADSTQELNRKATVKPQEQKAADERGDGPPRKAEPRSIDDAIVADDRAELIEAMRVKALDLLAEADGLDAEGDERAAVVREEAEALMERVDQAQGQGRLDV